MHNSVEQVPVAYRKLTQPVPGGGAVQLKESCCFALKLMSEWRVEQTCPRPMDWLASPPPPDMPSNLVRLLDIV